MRIAADYCRLACVLAVPKWGGNQRKDKMTAEMLLKDAATAWVSQELEQQRVPFIQQAVVVKRRFPNVAL